MTDRQRTVLGTTVIALFVSAVFYVPWRVDYSDDLKWAPFYRSPVTARSTLLDSTLSTSYVYRKGHRVYGIYLLQLVAIGSIGAIGYRMSGQKEET